MTMTTITCPDYASDMPSWCPRHAPDDAPVDAPDIPLSIIFDILEAPAFRKYSTWWVFLALHLALPGSAMIYDLWPMRGSLTHATAHSPPHGAQPNPTTDLLYNRPPQHRLIGLNAFVYTGLNAHAQKGMYGMEISVSNSSKSTALWC